MTIQSIRCPVSGVHVTRVTDFEGGVTQVICPDYDTTGTCRLAKKAYEGGPLSQLIERMAESTLGTRDIQCVMRSS